MAMSRRTASLAIDRITEAAEYTGGIVKASATVIKATTEVVTVYSTDLVSVSKTIYSETEEIKKAVLYLMEKVCDLTSDALKVSPYDEVSDSDSTPCTLIDDETKLRTALSKIYTFSIHASTAHAVAQSFISNSIPYDLVSALSYLIEVAKAASKAFTASAAAINAIYSTATTAAVLYPMDPAWVESEFAKEQNDDDEDDDDDDPALFGTDPTAAGSGYEFDDGNDGDGDDMD